MVEYTIDDIRGPTVAREMAQLKEFVLAQFNGAIADAEAAAAAAATAAANAVIGSLTSRVTALEGDMTTAQGDIITNANAILALDGAVVKLAGAQTISGIKQVPLEATGTASNQIASSQKVKNELDNYAPMLRTTDSQVAAGNKYMNTVTYIGSAAASSDTGYSLVANLGPIGSACFAFIAVSRGGGLMGAVSVDSSGIPTYTGTGISGSTSFGIALKDGNMYIAIKRTGSSGQNYTINIYGVTKGTSHYTIQPYDGNAPVEDVDNYTEACKI